MKITILCVGKIKEGFYREAAGEYIKRLSRYAKVEIREVADERTKEQPSEAERNLVLAAEGERLSRLWEPHGYTYVLDIDGAGMDSVAFARHLGARQTEGNSHLCFVIGGSLGLSEEIKQRANMRLSFSAMTFPHQLMRVILLEQLYRGFRILSNEPYHK